MKTKIEKVHRQLAELTAMREADQATIASLQGSRDRALELAGEVEVLKGERFALQHLTKELADALEAVLASACPNASEHLAMFDAWARGRTAIRAAGRLKADTPLTYGVVDFTDDRPVGDGAWDEAPEIGADHE